MAGTTKIKDYDLMQHQYMTANLFAILCKLENVEYNLEVFQAVLNHDLMETATRCDLPWPVKRLNDETSKAWDLIEEEVAKSNPHLSDYTDENFKLKMTEEQRAICKIADYLDLYYYVVREAELGNKTKEITEVIDNCEYLMPDICNKFGFSKTLEFIRSI